MSKREQGEEKTRCSPDQFRRGVRPLSRGVTPARGGVHQVVPRLYPVVHTLWSSGFLEGEGAEKRGEVAKVEILKATTG